MAETVGFEPTCPEPDNRISSAARYDHFDTSPYSQIAVPLKEYMKNCNERVLTLPQCETAEALDSIEEIVKIEGIDGIFIGPFDLSIALGIPAEFDNPKFTEAVERIKKVCHEAGKLCITFKA